MIKLVIFDLDGVIFDGKKIHFECLNRALADIDPKFVISEEDHHNRFDGIPTREKLEILSRERGLNFRDIPKINEKKQAETLLSIAGNVSHDYILLDVLRHLKLKGIKICVASNSVRKTINLVLEMKAVYDYVDFIISNEDVRNPKPHPEMFRRAMDHFDVSPVETLIAEDSYVGRTAAFLTGATVVPFNSTKDMSLALFEKHIQNAPRLKWSCDANVLVPMAGAGSRFKEKGYEKPKPMISVKGSPMIEKVVESLDIDAKYIFIVQNEHIENFSIKRSLWAIDKNCDILTHKGLSDGAARTALRAKDIIDNSKPLIIANSDQIIKWNAGNSLYSFFEGGLDGAILTFKADEPKWSYAKVGEDGLVSEVAEKKVISDNATVGVYLWKKGSDFVKYAEQMIEKDIRTNNEFYICPVFNEAIQDGKRIGIIPVDEMHGIGTPEDLEKYLAL